MTIALLILTYILWLGDVMSALKEQDSNLLITSAVIILLSWQTNQYWGLTMLIFCISLFMAIFFPPADEF